MASPTFSAYTEGASWDTTTTPKTTAGITAAVGDVIVLLSGNEDAGGDTLGTPTNTGTAQTWTAQQNNTTASTCAAKISGPTGGITAAFSSNTISNTTGGLRKFNVAAYVFTAASGIGASAKNTAPTTSGTISLTTTQDNSAVVVFVLDFQAQDGASRTWATVNGITPTLGNGLEKTYFRNALNYTVYSAYYNDVGAAGAKTVGISSPNTSTGYTVMAVEVKGATSTSTPVSPAKPGQTWLRQFRNRQTLPPPPAPVVVASTQDLPPQPPRRKLGFLPRRRSEVSEPPWTITVRPPAQQVRRVRPFMPRRKGESAEPPWTIVIQPPPQQVRRRVSVLPRHRSATVNYIVYPNLAQALPPQPGRRRLGFLPKHRSGSAQFIPVQVIVNTTQALPPQGWRHPYPTIRRPRVATVNFITYPNLTQPLPPQAQERRRAWFPARHRAATVNYVPAQVVTVVTLPPQQPARRRAPWLPPKRGHATQVLTVAVTSPAIQTKRRRLPLLPRKRRATSEPFLLGNTAPSIILKITGITYGLGGDGTLTTTTSGGGSITIGTAGDGGLTIGTAGDGSLTISTGSSGLSITE